MKRSCLLWTIVAVCFSCQQQYETPLLPVDAGMVSEGGHPVVSLTDSWVKQREQLNTQYLHSLDPDRLLHNFRVNAGIASSATPLEGWEAPWCGLRGHFTGHYLSAAARLVHTNNDTLLAQRLVYMVDALEQCQLALGDGGNLSAFPESDFTHVETYFTGVWAPYYTYNKVMQGLLHVYQYTDNKQAYRMVLRMADYVWNRMQRLDEATRKRMLVMLGANPQNEVGAMNEVLYALYDVSGDARHKELAVMFEPAWMMPSMLKHEDVLAGLHANTHIAIVNGYAKGYEATGDTRYQQATINFWDMLIHQHAYANGSSSGPRPNRTTPTALTAEHWGLPGQLAATLTGEIAESCVSHNTQKLSSALFAWTGNAQYADAYMNCFYNSVMALQSAHSGRCTYHLPLGSPRHKHWLTENDFRCCNGSSIEAYTMLNSSLYYHDAQSLWVNMYVPSVVKWSNGVSLTMKGEFPFDKQVSITIDSATDKEVAINLLIPSWCSHATIAINGKDMGAVTSMSYKQLKRKWKVGDYIEITFDYDFYAVPMPDAPNILAFFYGPLMLAFEGNQEVILQAPASEVVKKLKVMDNRCQAFTLHDADRDFQLKPLMLIENESYSVYATINPIYFDK